MNENGIEANDFSSCGPTIHAHTFEQQNKLFAWRRCTRLNDDTSAERTHTFDSS